MTDTAEIQSESTIIKIEVEGRTAEVEVSQRHLDRHGGEEALIAKVRKTIQSFFDMNKAREGFEEMFTAKTVRSRTYIFLVDNAGVPDFDEYKTWCIEEGLQPVDGVEFDKKVSGRTVKGRFNHIRRYGMRIGSIIVHRNKYQATSKMKITGFSANGKIHMDAGGSHEPVSFTVIS